MRTEYSCYDNVTGVSFLFASWEPCNAAAGFSIDKVWFNYLDSYLHNTLTELLVSTSLVRFLSDDACA